MKAAITLFAEQGYEETTVAEIAERAGLTKRTFFRYFSDKREVLFSGSEELGRLWLEAVAAAPTEATPLAVVTAGFDPLRDDGLHYAEALRKGGVEVEYRCYPDQIHGFMGMGILPDSLALATEVCDAMGRMMRRASRPRDRARD